MKTVDDKTIYYIVAHFSQGVRRMSSSQQTKYITKESEHPTTT
jgi:hypothetical protein